MRRAARHRGRSPTRRLRRSRPRSCTTSGATCSRNSASTALRWSIRSGGGRTGETFALERPQTTIGRSPDCDIFLDDVTVSRRHAIVGRGRRRLHARGSRQPERTFLNRSRIERGELENGDEVQIGKYRLIFLGQMTTTADRTPAPHDRLGLPAAPERVPGHLDLQDPLPRRPGPARAEADARRISAVQRGGRRAAGDDPAPPARRVPAAAGDPPGAGCAGLHGAQAPPGGPHGRRAQNRRRGTLRAGRHLAAAGARADGLRTARAAPERGRRERSQPSAPGSCRGADPRHLRSSRPRPINQADLLEALVPKLRSRNPEARQGAVEDSAGSPSSPRSSTSCSSGVLSGTGWRHERRPRRQDPRRPGLPEAGDRLQGHHAPARRRRGTAQRDRPDRRVGGAAEARPRPRRGGARLHHRRGARVPARLRLRRRPQAGQAPLAHRGREVRARIRLRLAGSTRRRDREGSAGA